MIKGIVLGIGLMVVSFGFGAWIVFAMDLLSGEFDKKDDKKK